VTDDLEKPKRRYGLGDPNAEVKPAPKAAPKPVYPKTSTNVFEEKLRQARAVREVLEYDVLYGQEPRRPRSRTIRAPGGSECFSFTFRELGDSDDYIVDSVEGEDKLRRALCVIWNKKLVSPDLYSIERIRDPKNEWNIVGFQVVFDGNKLPLESGALIEVVIPYGPPQVRRRPPDPPFKHHWPYSIP
jgi:hypothetical protein